MNEPTLRLCVQCGNPLFRGEQPLACLSCWRYDVEGFQAMLQLASIGLRTPGVRIHSTTNGNA